MDQGYYILWLAGVSLATFIVYGVDKSRARSGGWRVRESLLHLLAIAGGFPGGWLGRSLFHHKTQKGVFTFVLILSTFVHLGVIYLLYFN